MDEVEKAKGPPFLSMSPVPDAQAAPLSNLDVGQKSASLRSDGGRPFVGLTARILRIELTIVVSPTPGPPVITSALAVSARRIAVL